MFSGLYMMVGLQVDVATLAGGGGGLIRVWLRPIRWIGVGAYLGTHQGVWQRFHLVMKGSPAGGWALE